MVMNINILNNYPWKDLIDRITKRETAAVPSEAVVSPKKESAELCRKILRSHKGSERSLERVV